MSATPMTTPSPAPAATDLLRQARRLFLALSLCAGITVLLPALWTTEGFSIAIRLVVALVVAVAVADRARVVSSSPRDIQLIKARSWALVLIFSLPPVGTYLAWRLSGVLRHPALASWATAELADTGQAEPEAILALTCIQRTFRSLRTWGYFALILIALAAVAAPAAHGAPFADRRLPILGVAFFIAVVWIGCGAACAVLLRKPTAQSLRVVKYLSWMLVPFFPFGTWAGMVSLWNLHAGLTAQIAVTPQGRPRNDAE
jgi:hypothetical protein